MSKRTINNRAVGKHTGHACEGHLRGLLHHIAPEFGYTVARALPFEFPVEPDGVLLDQDGRVRAIFIVAYWDNARNSDSKFYRTRTEYAEAWHAHEQQGCHFASTFQVFTVLYGTPDGWKEKVLEDLSRQCPPLLFLPRVVCSHQLQSVIDDALRTYIERWESGHSNAREIVEKNVAERALGNTERELVTTITTLLRASQEAHGQAQRRTLRATKAVRVPCASVQTRYRQALSMLSVFGNGEVEGWHAHRSLKTQLSKEFARRAFFLGLGSFSVSRSITKRAVVSFALREPFSADNRYEPHLPDFTSWMQLDQNVLAWMLCAHRDRTSQPTSVFRGGTLDQAIGNVDAITEEMCGHGAQVVQYAALGDFRGVAELLANTQCIGATPGHQAGNSARFFPVWSSVVCAIAMAENDRSVRGALDSRRTEAPTTLEANSVARLLVNSITAQKIFSELVDFSRVFQMADLEGLAALSAPRLLQLNEPCSVLSDFFNTLSTNPSHNPLNELAAKWLAFRYPNAEWLGWPNKRSHNPSLLLGENGRRQWAFVGRGSFGVICAEVKSVSANHWGDKSKEIFDRVAELRSAASMAGVETLTILVFDGDLSSQNLRELQSGIGHDEVWTVDEVIEDMISHGWTGAL